MTANVGGDFIPGTELDPHDSIVDEGDELSTAIGGLKLTTIVKLGRWEDGLGTNADELGLVVGLDVARTRVELKSFVLIGLGLVRRCGVESIEEIVATLGSRSSLILGDFN